jgi:O-acetyl-ADP-ribose deacetylase (regulator of RNase III)
MHADWNPLDKLLFEMFQMITSKMDFMNTKFRQCRYRITQMMGQNKFLMVFDLCSMTEDVRLLLYDALNELFDRPISLRILLISEEDLKIQCYRMNLIPLTYSDMVTLFATSSPFVDQQRLEYTRSIAQSVQDFHNYIFRRESYKMNRKIDERMTKRSAELFVLLGKGIPKLILERCKDSDLYQKIRKVAMIDDVLLEKEYNTRYELDCALLWYKGAESKAKSQKQYILSYLLSDVVDQLEYRKNYKFTEEKLRELIINKSIEREKEFAIQVDSAKVMQLENELSQLRLQLESEKATKAKFPSGVCYHVAHDDLPLEIKKALENAPLHPASEEDIDGRMSTIGSLLLVKDQLLTTLPMSHTRSPTETLGLVSVYDIKHRSYSFKFFIQSGSVATFSSEYGNTGIVVASNESCLGNVGILKVITELGGQRLCDDVMNLPTIDMKGELGEVRCLPGDAVKVSGGPYESLQVKVIIFAVGPWFAAENANHRVEILRKSYQRALEIAKDSKLEAIAFSLVGASSRSGLDWKECIATAINTIACFQGYENLKEIHLYGYYEDEVNELKAAGKKSCKNFPFMSKCHQEEFLTTNKSFELDNSKSTEQTKSQLCVENVVQKLNRLHKELDRMKEVVECLKNDTNVNIHHIDMHGTITSSTSTNLPGKRSDDTTTESEEVDDGEIVGRIISIPPVKNDNQKDVNVMGKFQIQQPGYTAFHYIIQRGSVQSFSPPSDKDSAIVVASNEFCRSDLGVLGAVTQCGGEMLTKDMLTLPKIGPDGERCAPGQAVHVGRGSYGDLQVPYVIFAVASTSGNKNHRNWNEILMNTYRNALSISKTLKLEAIAFSLIGAGIRGDQNWKEALRIGVHTICSFIGYPELKEIHHFGYDTREADELKIACDELQNKHRYMSHSIRSIPLQPGDSVSVITLPTVLMEQSGSEQPSYQEPSVGLRDTYSKGSKHDTRSVMNDSSGSYSRNRVTNSKPMTRIVSLPYQNLREANIVASFWIKRKEFGFYYVIHKGSIESFSGVNNMMKSGIVVASNESCSGSSGILGRITKLGGDKLKKAVKNLPSKHGDGRKRCLPGNAVVVGNGKYGSIQVPYIIFAVASNAQLRQEANQKDPQILVMDAYENALLIAKKFKLESVAFSLIGAGNRGGQDRESSIKIGVAAIATFNGYPELKEIHHFGYQDHEVSELTKACMTWCNDSVKDDGESEI